ncbi:MAG: SH3 domain-containing protein [Rhodobacteraceae bacterium]|nr:SH3 domain-containing protein [Paracoccaceae bacterium]
MRTLIALLCSMIVSAAAWGQTYPSFHSVTGVAADDFLNVRQAPSADAEIIGTLAPYAKNVEIVSSDQTGRWGLTNLGETAGWVALRYLQKDADDPEYPISRTLSCYGTEPFWSLKIQQSGPSDYSDQNGVEQTFATGTWQRGRGRPDVFVLNLEQTYYAVLRYEQCDDGMSDRMFGLSINLIFRDTTPQLLSGCCSLLK